MKPPVRLAAFGRAAAATAARALPAGERHKPAPRRSGACLLLGLLLAVASPAHGFDGAAGSPPPAAEVALHGSGGPTAANWVVLDARGIAAWRAKGDARWQRFTRGEVLPPGCEIETGSDGEVALVAGGDQLTIGPQGRLIVPVAKPGQDRRLRHERGRILVQIESRAARDVRVETPLLSLGIKGTTFEVLVEPAQDSVLVHDGAVEVTTPDGSAPVGLGADEGLRQPAAPGSAPARFTIPAPQSPAGAAAAPAWRLPAAADPAGQPADGLTAARVGPDQARDPAAAAAGGGSARAQPAGARGGVGLAQLGRTPSWGSIAVAAVGLLILMFPALALLQRLREHWAGRPEFTDQRRRRLVRG